MRGDLHTRSPRPDVGAARASGWIDSRDRFKQRARVGVPRRTEDVSGASVLDDAACEHDSHGVGELPDYGEIVRNEQVGQLEFVLKFPEEIQDLVDTIDEELIDSVGISRQEVIVHVHQGRDLGVFSTRNFEGNGGHERLS